MDISHFSKHQLPKIYKYALLIFSLICSGCSLYVILKEKELVCSIILGIVGLGGITSFIMFVRDKHKGKYYIRKNIMFYGIFMGLSMIFLYTVKHEMLKVIGSYVMFLIWLFAYFLIKRQESNEK